MGSRLRENVKHLFECFCEIAAPVGEKEAWVLQRFPESFSDQEILKFVPKFAYPCEFENSVVQHFSFVLTSIDSKWTFGFCRHDPKTETALVILSALPWHEIFCKLLNHIATLKIRGGCGDLWKFLGDVYKSGVPSSGSSIAIPLPDPHIIFVCQSPKQFQLPSIPDNKNLTEYYSAVDYHNMMTIFASMLYERRIIFTSKKLSRLSACVQACNALIYPMIWQHIYIPVLPLSLMDYLSAPMPFLIGVPAPILQRMRKSDLGEVVILDADNNAIETPFQDLESLPQDVVSNLQRALRNRAALLGDGVSRAFLRALVQLTAGYREALTLQQGEHITFNQDAFVESRPASMQPFLRKMLELQIFQQFIEERLHMLNSGLGFSDEFEMEACNYADKTSSKFKQQYREWTNTMRKEGSAFFRSVKDKVKDKGKDVRTAYKGLKWKGRSNRDENRMRYQQPRSAPSSPTLDRRPATFTSPSKPSGGFTATTSYRKELHLRNIAIPDTSRKQYSPLNPSSSEEPESPPERLDIDLMQELRDVIYPDTPPVDRTFKPVRSLDSLRSAWSGRLRHGPPPRTATSDSCKNSQTPNSNSSTLDSSSSSLELQATHCTFNVNNTITISDTLLNVSDTSSSNGNSSFNINGSCTLATSLSEPLINIKVPNEAPCTYLDSSSESTHFVSINSTSPEQRRASTTHKFINPTNPFIGSDVHQPEPVQLKLDEHNDASVTLNTNCISKSNHPHSFKTLDQSSRTCNSSLLDGNLNITYPNLQTNAVDPFDTSQVLSLFHSQNSILSSVSPKLPISTQPLLPLNTQHHPAHTKESPDLIRLDSTNSDEDFDPLLSRSSKFNSSKQMTQSLHLPQMGEGLSNPLYSYFLPQCKNPDGQLGQNMHDKVRDFDLLREYGLDFNKFSLTNGASSSRKDTTSNLNSSGTNNSVENAFGPTHDAPSAKFKRNWTKFE